MIEPGFKPKQSGYIDLAFFLYPDAVVFSDGLGIIPQGGLEICRGVFGFKIIGRVTLSLVDGDQGC